MCFLLIWRLLAAAAWSQSAEVRNPRTAPEDVAAGGRIYRSHCAECHGLKGEGGRGPDLTGAEYRHGGSDAALFKTIGNGVPGTQMPGVYYEDHQIWQIVAFVRSLASGGGRLKIAGDPSAGEKIFHGKGGCAGCHMVRGRGGRFGPDLSAIGSSRSPSNLRASILNPSDDLPMRWWIVEATAKSGASYRGLRLNEDTYTIQLLDFRKDLVSLRKTDLARLHVESKTSFMPAYEGKLAPGEISDLVAYLYGLRGKAREE
ncbi:MAG: Cbb3-type cytochrome c oxidase subunit CcoP [Bryobacteraceae bacterium]|nr:Cbb3-type cytochrome c oxidase subunit CcoP [Bryobacteraceae bacterium]